MRHISSSSHENYYCYSCFYSFRTQSKLKEHYELCKNDKQCPVKVPKQGQDFISPRFESKTLRINDVIYLDLECILEDYDLNQNDKNIPWTIKKNMHTVCGYSITNVSDHNNECITDYYHGKDSLEVLCNTLTRYAKKIIETKKYEECESITKSQQDNYEKEDKCHICKTQSITDKKHEFSKN